MELLMTKEQIHGFTNFVFVEIKKKIKNYVEMDMPCIVCIVCVFFLL